MHEVDIFKVLIFVFTWLYNFSFSREILQSPLYSGQFAKSLQFTFANLLLSKAKIIDGYHKLEFEFIFETLFLHRELFVPQMMS